MATSRLLQRLDTGDSTSSNRRQIETFKVDTSGGAVSISKGDVLAFDLNQTDFGDKVLFVQLADLADTTAFRAVGVAAADYSFGQNEDAKVDVVVAGLCDIKVAANTIAGEGLVISATPGQADTYAAAAVTPYIATALEATAASPGVIKGIFLPQF